MAYRFGDFALAPERYELRMRGREVAIEPRVLEVLTYLVENRGRIVPKEELLEELWSEEYVSESALTRTIRELRKAVGDSAGDPRFVRTVYGRGYLWIADVAGGPEEGEALKPAEPGGEASTGSTPATPVRAKAPGSPFVGREQEMDRLVRLLEDVLGGRGHLVMLVGEPGIGKTRTAQALGAKASEKGASVLWGRSLEGWRAPPYWPWVQVIRAYLETVDAELLAGEMGVGASDIVDLVPEIRDLLPDLQPTPTLGDPEQARFRLFDSITRFLRRASRRRPLMLVLDNLHWADKPSLRLLEVLAHELTSSHLLVVGTYRDIELSRSHPLSDTLGELGREGLFERVPLKGLSHEEAYRFMVEVAGTEVPRGLSQAVHAQTEGNPFFLTEVARLLAQEGVFAAAAAAAQSSDERQLVLSIPEGVREVVGRRLNRLSELCNRVLGVASVVGRAFGRAELEHLLPDVEPHDLLDAAEEAVATGVLHELPDVVGRYQFTHALIRETLYEELSTARRIQEHRRIAVALEEVYASDLEPHLPLLAYHFFEAAPAGVADRAMDYNARAGRQAMEVFAYEEAARFLERALESMELVETADERLRCRFLLELGDAWRGAGEMRLALETFVRAAANAREHGWSDELAEAALGLQFGLFGDAAVRLLEEALSVIGSEDSALRVRVLSELGTACFHSGQEDRGTTLTGEALAMARRVGEPSALYVAFRSTIPTFNASAPRRELSGRDLPEDVAERFMALRDLAVPSFAAAADWLGTSEEMLALSEQLGETSALIDVHGYRAHLFISLCQVDKLRSEIDGYSQRAARLRQPVYSCLEPLHRGSLATMAGEFSEAERFIGQAREAGHRIRFPNTDGIFGLQMFVLRRLQGRLEEIAGVVEHFVGQRSRGSVWGPGLAVIYADLGDLDKAREAYEPLSASGFTDVPRDVLWLTSLTYLSEVAVALDDRPGCERLFELIAPTRDSAITGGGIASLGSTGGYLGALAATAGAWNEAMEHFEVGLEMNSRMGAVPWLALTRESYARALLRRDESGDRQKAAELLREALAVARKISMRGLEARSAATLEELEETASNGESFPDELSVREVDVLRLLAVGSSNREIADELSISLNTVASHVRSVLAKTQSSNRTEAAVYAIRKGLVGPAP